MSENLPRSSKSRKRRTASLKVNPPLDLKPQIAAARDLIKSLDVNSSNGPEEVDSIIKFCNSALKNRQNNRGGVITRLLSAAKAKQIELEPRFHGERMLRLPQELLANIFEFATADGHCRKTAFAISHVNQMWRALALRLPHLWAHIFLPYHTQYITQMLACILDRSKNVPLKVSISGNEGLSYLHSLRSRIVWFESAGWFRGDIQDLDLPNVEYASMQGSIFLRFMNVPKLRHLCIGTWDTTIFNTGSTYDALRTLKCPLRTGTDIQALSACPNLRCAFFELSFFGQEDEIPKLTLLFLELLAISGAGVLDSERLLALADLPRLKHLTLCVRHRLRFEVFDGSPTFLPQLETLRVEYDGFEMAGRKESERISHLLMRTPNIRKLTITRLYLIYELPDMTARFNSNPVSKDESVPQEVANDPFLPRLHTLVLLDCFKLPLLSTELKKLMFQWASSRHSDGDGSVQLAFRTNCVEQRCLTRLKNSWPGVVASPTKGDLIDVNGEHWLMDELIE